MGSVLAVGLATIGWLGWSWWFAEPWSELERIAGTFPVPANYELESRARVGDRPAVCDINPACNDPFLGASYRATTPDDDVCETIDRALESWEADGFSLIPQNNYTRNPTMPCVIDGEIDGHRVQVIGFSSRTEPDGTVDEGAAIRVVIS